MQSLKAVFMGHKVISGLRYVTFTNKFLNAFAKERSHLLASYNWILNNYETKDNKILYLIDFVSYDFGIRFLTNY